MALHLARESERQLRPFWDAAARADERTLRGGLRHLPLTDPSRALLALAEDAFGFLLERGILPATRVDPVIFRALLRAFHMLETPESIITNPIVLARALPVLRRVLRGDAPPPPFPAVHRADALAQLAAAS
jgi:hypothetical protein